ncbi:MAG: YraN family protein [Myxococcales bacterium]|nr:YraN family protein [Myxococcales bacterium]
MSERHRVGREAEGLVVDYLLGRGFSIEATNLRLGALEIDIVARQGALVVVVEVRTRGPGAWTSGFGSISALKRKRIRWAGERLWRMRYRNDASVERMRFDAAAVTFGTTGPAVEYVEGAF